MNGFSMTKDKRTTSRPVREAETHLTKNCPLVLRHTMERDLTREVPLLEEHRMVPTSATRPLGAAPERWVPKAPGLENPWG